MATDPSVHNPAMLASRFINQTHKNIFLTGKAGTGKTTFLRQVVQNTHKKSIIVAPTGIAAINAGGVTIHSLFQLPFGNFVPAYYTASGQHQHLKITDPLALIKNLQMSDAKRKLLRELELLIIDEVSMLRADLLDAIDLVLRHVRRKSYAPFGGVQVLFIGDLLQLPPVVKDEEWQLLKTFYNSIYFFDALVLQPNKPVYIELDKIYRQGDGRFVALLNNLRNNQVTGEDIALLNSFYKPGFKPSPTDNYITLTTHNYKANTLNKDFLQELKNKSYFFEAVIDGDFNEFAYPLEKTLELKAGAQIMFVKNDPTGEQRFFNGKIGIVSGLSDKKIEVKFDDSNKFITVEKYEWENMKFELNLETNEIEEKVTGTFTHYPVKLAWAITVHKSQGLTFDKAIVDIGSAFAPGQVYVALSRLRSLDGLVLTSHINYNSISQDSNVTAFSKIKSEQENLDELVEKEAALFLKNYVLQSFDFAPLSNKLNYHTESYIKDEKRSAKQKYQQWSQGIKEQLSDIKPHADKFRQQVAQILDSNTGGYLDLLNKRVLAAKDYFAPLFNAISKSVFDHIEIVKSEKKVKSYLNELLELETSFYEQVKRMNKASVLINAMLTNTEFNGEDVRKLLHDPNRSEQIKRALLMPEKTGQETKKQKKEKTKTSGKKLLVKTDKTDTKAETFRLLGEGKNIAEIAQLRGMTTGTIEGHLAFYVAKGNLKATQFMTAEKLEHIITVSKKLNTFQPGSIKQALSADYSYGEIKLALAASVAVDGV